MKKIDGDSLINLMCVKCGKPTYAYIMEAEKDLYLELKSKALCIDCIEKRIKDTYSKEVL